MLITEVSGDGSERTWRPPVTTRIAQAVVLGVFPALPGLWLALTLVTNQVPDGGWIALALAAVAWGWLGWRALAQSVTLTPDTLVIRDILATRRVPLAVIIAVGFRWGRLTVTCGHGAAAGRRFAVGSVHLGSSYWSGLRGDADAVAGAIADAAGLAPPPPRREIISRNWAWVMLLAAALCFGLGVYYGPLQGMSVRHRPFALYLVGGELYGVGIGMLGFAFQIIRDHRRKRTRQAAAGEYD